MALRKQPFIIQVDVILPISQRVIERIVNWTVNRNLAAFAIDLVPELSQYWENHRRFYFLDVFEKYENWQDQFFQFDNAEIKSKTYGYAYKALTCTYVFDKVIQIFIIERLKNSRLGKEFVFNGLSLDTIRFYEFYFGNVMPDLKSNIWYFRRLINLGLSVFVFFITLARIIWRIRAGWKPVPVDLAFDYSKDIREFYLFTEIAECGHVLLIDRYPWLENSPVLPIFNSTRCTVTDGYFTILNAFPAAFMAIKDIFLIFCKFNNLAPGHFYHLVVLPDKKLRFRSLFQRFPPRHCIGRDEYNPDHILRTQELNRIGIKSLGLTNTFVTTWASSAPNVRYVAFDKYYVFSAPLLTGQSKNWRKDMEVESIGSYAVSRGDLAELAGPNSDTILFSIRIAFSSEEMVRMVRLTAETFPNRSIIVQLKVAHIVDPDQKKDLTKQCTDGLLNVEVVTGDIYKLMRNCQYHISDVSGIIAEGIQMRNTVFFADVLDMQSSIYRLFPGLSVKTAEELVDRLIAIEKKTMTYPTKEYLEILGLQHNKTAFDILRSDLGLPSKATS